ncbi:unnamed protein product [Symbiodinium necroappetens]|uniref:Uncharacterized protein n=1 Tax=Symbiodinium necroappetens TaxID=1628268 RepID=A0A813ASR9_9DINO|nr:unnamed protein product [Symbiodinium necroappetens]
MQLSASAVGINQLSARELQLLRGEVEFSGLGTGGHRAKYVIAPPEMESADEILRWMFVRQDGWRLKPPNLLLSCYGGRDHYVNWANSPTLRNREAWATATGGADDWKFRQKFTSRLSEISSGVCQAVTECGGWFDLGTGPRGGLNEVLMDGLKVYWSALDAWQDTRPTTSCSACASCRTRSSRKAFSSVHRLCLHPVQLTSRKS